MPTVVHHFTTRLTTATIEALGDPIVQVDVTDPIQLDGVKVDDGAVLTSDDGDVFIGDVDQVNPERGYVVLRLR